MDHRDSLVITISNGLTAIFAGFVVFAYIGYLSKLTEQPVQDVVSSGSGLAFIVFPFAVTQLAGAPFWAVLFFIMMLTLGLDSQASAHSFFFCFNCVQFLARPLINLYLMTFIL